MCKAARSRSLIADFSPCVGGGRLDMHGMAGHHQRSLKESCKQQDGSSSHFVAVGMEDFLARLIYGSLV